MFPRNVESLQNCFNICSFMYLIVNSNIYPFEKFLYWMKNADIKRNLLIGVLPFTNLLFLGLNILFASSLPCCCKDFFYLPCIHKHREDTVDHLVRTESMKN